MEQISVLIAEYAGTFLLLASVLVPLVIEAFYTYVWQPVGKLLNSVMTFVIAIATTFLAWKLSALLGVGFLAELEVYWHVLLYGIGAAVFANWTWVSVDFIKMIITFILTLNPQVLSAKRK
jgi:hypothetical protein